MKDIFRYQVWHLLCLALLLIGAQLSVVMFSEIKEGRLLGIQTTFWFWVSITTPIIHQTYVWLIWRIELHKKFFTNQWGMHSFKWYAVGFTILFIGRIVSISVLAASNRNTLVLPIVLTTTLVIIAIAAVLIVVHSIVKYFSFKRALGIDHFEKKSNRILVKKGVFGISNNAMYCIGFIGFYLPGLLLLSKAALFSALFSHLYIWVHFFCTEKPDMNIIYQ